MHTRYVTDQVKAGRALLGFMEDQEALEFLTARCSFEGAKDEDLRALWKNAKSAMAALTQANLAPEILGIDAEFETQLSTVTKSPTFPEAVGNSRWSFKLVEIDKLVCFQKYVDTDYSREMAGDARIDDMGTLIEFCLPRSPAKRLVGATIDSTENAYTLYSSVMDFRILGGMQFEDPISKRKSFGFTVGWGVPFVQIVHFQDRYFLKNGYHRVYVIREKGVRHVPCILIDGTKFTDTGAQRPGFFPETVLMAGRPPIFADFLTDEVAPRIKLRPLTKVVRISANDFVLPATVQMPMEAGHEALPTAIGIAVAAEQSEFEDFKIEKEDWNVYKLTDGTILKLRQILLAVRKDPATGDLQPSLSNLIMAVLPPKILQGASSSLKYSPQELSESVIEGGVKYEVVQEVANEYVTKGGLKLVVRLRSINVGKTSKYDASGYPIYLVNAATEIQAVLRTGQ